MSTPHSMSAAMIDETAMEHDKGDSEQVHRLTSETGAELCRSNAPHVKRAMNELAETDLEKHNPPMSNSSIMSSRNKTPAVVTNKAATGERALDEADKRAIDPKPFAFLRLPAELRNRIYELLLTDTRGPTDHADSVILLNDLNRRKERRTAPGLPAMSTGLSNKSKQLAKRYHMLNNDESTMARLKKRVTGLPPLLQTAILRVCRQTHYEGAAILYCKNVFALIVPFARRNDTLELWFPTGLDLTRIQHIRLELQLPTYSFINTTTNTANVYNFSAPWFFFRHITALKTVRMTLTSDNETTAHIEKKRFERFWHIMPVCRQVMQELIAAIPMGIEVKMGLTKEEKILCDYGGFCPVRGCVLRKIYRTYKGVQGADMEVLSIKGIDQALVYQYAVDGDGGDSDQEDDV